MNHLQLCICRHFRIDHSTKLAPVRVSSKVWKCTSSGRGPGSITPSLPMNAISSRCATGVSAVFLPGLQYRSIPMKI